MHICVSSIRLILADSDAVGTLGWIHAASKARAAAAVGEPIAGADRQGRGSRPAGVSGSPGQSANRKIHNAGLSQHWTHRPERGANM